MILTLPCSGMPDYKVISELFALLLAQYGLIRYCVNSDFSKAGRLT